MGFIMREGFPDIPSCWDIDFSIRGIVQIHQTQKIGLEAFERREPQAARVHLNVEILGEFVFRERKHSEADLV